MASSFVLCSVVSFIAITELYCNEIYVPHDKINLPKIWFVYTKKSFERSLKRRKTAPDMLSFLVKGVSFAKRDKTNQNKILQRNQ